MANYNSIVVDNCIYLMTPPYLEGATAFRDGQKADQNPYSSTSLERSHWDNGYTHEMLGEHFRLGYDLIQVGFSGRRFGEDPEIPRDKSGTIDKVWAAERRRNFGLLAAGDLPERALAY